MRLSDLKHSPACSPFNSEQHRVPLPIAVKVRRVISDQPRSLTWGLWRHCLDIGATWTKSQAAVAEYRIDVEFFTKNHGVLWSPPLSIYGLIARYMTFKGCGLPINIETLCTFDRKIINHAIPSYSIAPSKVSNKLRVWGKEILPPVCAMLIRKWLRLPTEPLTSA